MKRDARRVAHGSIVSMLRSRSSWLPAVLAPVAMIVCTLGMPGPAEACTNAQTCSNSYQVNEAFFGNGGSLDSTCSTTYCAKQAAGETGTGNVLGSSYQAQAGFNTDRSPSLTMVVTSANINLGALSAGTTATATSSFSVKSYLASGYVVVTAANPPTSGSHTLTALTVPTASNTAAEQFGMNLVADTSPSISGSSNPVQVPSSAFSFGTAAHNSSSDYYDTPNQFMYTNGDTIAKSTKSSGETDYTISYIFNTTNLTPGGVYTFNQVLVATSTF